MSGYELLKGAYLRLGINNETTACGNTTQRDLEIINQILTDIKLNRIDELSQKIDCSAAAAEAVCSGVAMLLSVLENDNDKNLIYTAVYNAKRAALLGKTEKIEDVLPKTESGGI